MRKLFYLVCLTTMGLISGLSGCSDELITLNQREDRPSNHRKTNLELALDRADDFFAQMGDATRAVRRVGTVQYVCTQTTRAGEQDTLLYLVNYADNQGFALLGANPAVNDIYAISPTGHLTYEDFAVNPVLSDFLYDAATYAYITPGTQVSDSVVPWKYWAYKNIDRGDEMISSTAANWHQQDPYNEFLGKHPFVGCVPLSVGMFLSHYEKPDGKKYSWPDDSTKFDFDWYRILYDDNKAVRDTAAAEMFAFLGKPGLLNSKYEADGTETYSKYIVPTLDSLGLGPIGFRKMSLSSIIYARRDTVAAIDSVARFMVKGMTVDSLVYNGITYDSVVYKYKAGPLITVGYGPTENDADHAWVISAVITRKKCAVDAQGRYLFQPPLYVTALPMWHCLWGQADKTQDGWYVYLKDKMEMDSVQYDPYNKFVINGGLWPTGVIMRPAYTSWHVYGGACPKVEKK